MLADAGDAGGGEGESASGSRKRNMIRTAGGKRAESINKFKPFTPSLSPSLSPTLPVRHDSFILLTHKHDTERLLLFEVDAAAPRQGGWAGGMQKVGVLR